MHEIISSRSNPLVKQIRSLRQKKSRDETGLFLAEGIRPIGEAVDAGWELEKLVYAPDQLTSEFATRLLDEQMNHGVHCVAVTSSLFADLADKENPQGILAIIRQRHLTLETVEIEKFRFGAALVSPQDPGNVGTILRTLDAVGADGMFLLDGGVELYHPSVVRASMGTLFWKPVVRTSFEEFVTWARSHGYLLIGTSAHTQTDYRELKRTNRQTILLFGSEQKGLSPEQLACCELNVSMPMKGRASSLNLAVAAGILLYTVMDQIK